MSRVSFNRKRAKLKQLLGIRARLALLAVILVAPLMFERVRSLEDTRAKQIAQASPGILQPRPAQRRYPARSDLLGRDHPEIGRLYPRLRRRHRPELRHPARQPAVNLPWIRAVMIVGGDGRIQCSTNNMYVGLDLCDRPYLKQAQETHNFVFSDFSVRRADQHADRHGGLSGLRVQHDSGRRHPRQHQPRLDVEADEQSRRPPRHHAVLVDSAGTVLAAPADQAQPDRPPARQRCRCCRRSPTGR